MISFKGWSGLLRLALVVLLSGCVSQPDVQTAQRSQRLPVPFVEQEAAYCGPASLSSLLQFYGRPVSVEALLPQVYLPGKEGSLAVEMKAASRRNGLLPYPLPRNIDAMLQELDAGNPVLVLQNLGFNWWPQWHYALVVGYEKGGRRLLLHSGSRPYYAIATGTFLKTWARADNWALVAVPPSRVPASAEVLSFLQALQELQRVGQLESVEQGLALQEAVSRWPESGVAAFAWANMLLAKERHEEASRMFIQGLVREPDNALAWNNLAYTLMWLGCPEQSRQAIDRALQLSPADPRIQQSSAELLQQADTGAGSECPRLPQ